MQVYLLRHGETQWNVQCRMQGHFDSPLTELGCYQADQAGRYLRDKQITHIISSDLGRTVDTANLIARYCDCQPQIDARLREMSMGILEGKHVEQLSDEEQQWRDLALGGHEDQRIPDGETLAEVASRMREVLDYCLTLPENSRPLLVSHGIAIATLLNTILGLPAFAKRHFRLRNCSLSLVEYQPTLWGKRDWLVEFLADSHFLTQQALDEISDK